MAWNPFAGQQGPMGQGPQQQPPMGFGMGMPQQGPPQSMQETVEMLITAMGQSVINSNAQVGNLAQLIAQNHRESSSNGGYRALKPKKDLTRLGCDNARACMTEFYQFEVDLNELGVVPQSEAAYRHLRAMVEGKARDVCDLATVQGQGMKLVQQSDSDHSSI